MFCSLGVSGYYTPLWACLVASLWRYKAVYIHLSPSFHFIDEVLKVILFAAQLSHPHLLSTLLGIEHWLGKKVLNGSYCLSEHALLFGIINCFTALFCEGLIFIPRWLYKDFHCFSMKSMAWLILVHDTSSFWGFFSEIEMDCFCVCFSAQNVIYSSLNQNSMIIPFPVSSIVES